MDEEPLAREMKKYHQIVSRTKNRLIMFRRKYIPYFMFYGQEVNVRVTLRENRLQPCSPDKALPQLTSGHFHKIEKMLSEVGIDFDTGIGFEGRDWEWDWSLRGPVSVKFRSVCKTKERRS